MTKKYDFNIQTDLEAFNKFSEENSGSIYQSSYWASVKNMWKPYYYMAYDGHVPVFACLCLERNVKVGKLWYCPDSFVCDYKNKELISQFSSFIKEEMKKHNIFTLLCDPTIITKINKDKIDNNEAFNNLISAGFEENKDKEFYIVQPNITVGVHLENEDKRFTCDEILAKCEKGVRHGLKTGIAGGLKYEKFTSVKGNGIIDEFYGIMTETSDRVSFIQRTKDYYENIIESLQGHATLDMVYYDVKEEKEKNRQNLAKRDELLAKYEKKAEPRIKKEIDDINKQIKTYDKVMDEIKKEYSEIPERIYLAGGITSYFGKTSICLYGGTRNILRNTLKPSNYLNWIRLEESINKGCAFHDLGRVTGNPYDENNPLFGLCSYKKSFAGDFVEYVGDMYLTVNKFKLLLFCNVLPLYQKLKNRVFKKIIKRTR